MTSTSEGKIHIFKYRSTGRVENYNRLMHTFTGHHKAVTSISKFQNSTNLILSVSLDSTARLWCINTFQHHYTFQLSSGLNFVKIY
jgi:WD40 repeat protein